jgi:riboflavin synthase
MFTGIVEERGRVVAAGPRLEVACRTVSADSPAGASLSVNGVCLTVVERRSLGEGGEVSLTFDLSPETLARSSLGSLVPGGTVNLERPVRVLGRLGGHLVQGHVDGVGTVGRIRPAEIGVEMEIEVPARLAPYLTEKGSVAVDGVSLTVTYVESELFGVALIPHTLRATTLGSLSPGDRVNLEVDVMAKYVESLLRRSG